MPWELRSCDNMDPAPSRKGTGFVQPLAPHTHWHIDIAHVNVAATFFSMAIAAPSCTGSWSMSRSSCSARASACRGTATTHLDNGPQSIARDFKNFLRIAGMTHVGTSPSYPQSNGKLERYHHTIKSDALRVKSPSSPQQARHAIDEFVTHYNAVRLRSAIGFVTPNDKLAGSRARHLART